MRVLLLMLVTMISSYSLTTSSSEKNLFLDAFLEPTAKENASYYGQIVETTLSGVHFKAFFMSGEIKMDGWYKDEDLKTQDGHFTYYFKSGQKESQGLYIKGYKSGVWQRFERDGKRKPEKVYASYETMKALEESKLLEAKK